MKLLNETCKLPLVAESLPQLVGLRHVDHGQSVACLSSQQHEVNASVVVLTRLLSDTTQTETLLNCNLSRWYNGSD